MQYRESALRKRRDPEQLDVPVRLTPPRSWITLAALFATVIAGSFWATFGTLPVSLAAMGALTYEGGSFRVQALPTGQITKLFVEMGDEFALGDRIANLRIDEGTRTIRATESGRVVSMLAAVGQVVQTGETLVVAERAPKKDDRLVAVMYLPSAQVGRTAVGAPVDLTVESVPARTYGVLRGRVKSISKFTENYRQIGTFLGDEVRAKQLVGDGAAHKVTVEISSANTKSGFEWSTEDGPPFRLDSRVGVQGRVHQPALRPIDWVLP